MNLTCLSVSGPDFSGRIQDRRATTLRSKSDIMQFSFYLSALVFGSLDVDEKRNAEKSDYIYHFLQFPFYASDILELVSLQPVFVHLLI